MRRLIINADDFGVDRERDRGILKMARRGTVTSVTALANGAAFEADIGKLLAIPGIGVGIHLNLTEGRPLTTGMRPPLFQGKEAFWRGDGPGRIHGVDGELREQMDRFLSAVGRPPTHVDGHQHVHVAPAIVPAVIRLCRGYGIGGIRLPIEPGLPPGLPLMRRWTSLARKAAARFHRAGLRSPDRFRGMAFLACPTAATLAASLRSIRDGETVELMVHPGYRRAGNGSSFSSPAREREMDILLRPSARRIFDRFSLISYSGI